MANEKINEYLDSAVTPDNLAEFDMDNWIGGAFVSTRIKYSDLKAAMGTGHLGNTNLTQTDPVRTFTLDSSEAASMLVFRNSNLDNSLTINGMCDVYNHGLVGVSTNTFFGLDIGRLITGANNSAYGVQALKDMTTGANNVAIGYNAGRYIIGGVVDNLTGSQSIYLGTGTQPKVDGGDNEIIIGYATQGQGDNTVVIGNGNIVANYFTGKIYDTDLVGVGDRNVVADATGYLKIGNSSGILTRFATFAAFPAMGSDTLLYVANDSDFLYLWDADSLGYKKVGNEGIYNLDGTFSDNTRIASLKLDTIAATLSFTNASGNSILKINGARSLFLDNLKAPAGNSYTLYIDDQGLVSSAATSAAFVNKYSADLVYVAATALTVTHNLACLKACTLSFVDGAGAVVEPDTIDTFTSNSVKVTFATAGTYTTTIIG